MTAPARLASCCGPFDSVLIANRGEIGARILRSVQAAGLRGLAVYSDLDAGHTWLREADASHALGGARAADSYLRQDAMLQAARALGAQAVHPGYGFLAENPDFAQAVQAAGLIWIGPSPATMRALGDKAAAKRLLADSAVPLLPGYAGAAQDADSLQAAAHAIGLPLMIKAAAGGGGRGMRRVDDFAELPQALQRAASEAQQAFGNPSLLLEKALDAPRHIEVQIMADAHGNLLLLGERECSVQRRHQKIIEECPAPGLTAAQRARLYAAAHTLLQTAAQAGFPYLGAGTLEFLFDGEQFYFMEINARLQVEHTVTEMVLGVDLVDWQLRVAAGQALPLTQQQIDARLAQGGHAIQVRLCAEDPQQDCLPQTGTVLEWQPGPGLRVDSALYAGMQLGSAYDSLLAKLIAHGATRTQARQRLLHGLARTRLPRKPHKLALLRACLPDAHIAPRQRDNGRLPRQL